MVDQSWCPFRQLVHQRGVGLSFTPMAHARLVVEDEKYRANLIADLDQSPRPVIVQLAANEIGHFVEAVKVLAAHCDAIDLNLGCPQHIARKGHYGAFLMLTESDRFLIGQMIEAAKEHHPITVKIRVFDEIKATIDYAKMIQAAGASALTVHGRTINQKRDLTGLASWDHIRQVKQSLSIPIIANGNIRNVFFFSLIPFAYAYFINAPNGTCVFRH